MKRYQLPLATCLLVLGGGALSACSGIRHYTYEIEYTTDREPHTVRLWYDEGQGQGEKPAYSLTFPQSYYGYRDNHEAENQTTIGLLLDRRTLKPLTQVIAAETGLTESLDTPRWKEGALKKLVVGKYAGRRLFVTINGRTAPAASRTDPAKVYGEMYQKAGEQGSLTVYKLRIPDDYPDRGLPGIAGFATTRRELRFHCLPAVPRCSVDQSYRDSTVSISIERSNLDEAPALMTGILKILDQHLT